MTVSSPLCWTLMLLSYLWLQFHVFITFHLVPWCCVWVLGYYFLPVICLNCRVLLFIVPTCRPCTRIALEWECCSISFGLCLDFDGISLPIGYSISWRLCSVFYDYLGWALIVYSNSTLLSIYLILRYNHVGYLLCEYPIRTLLFCFVRESGLMVMYDGMIFH